MRCANCGHLLPVHYLYQLCMECRLLPGVIAEPIDAEDENGAYEDIDINHDEQNNEYEHD